MVQMYTPLRYPGGKLKTYHRVRRIIEQNELTGNTYVEPFAGGFGVGIRLLLDGIVDRVILNDFDHRVFSFWHSVLHASEGLCQLVENTPITLEERARQKEIFRSVDATHLEYGFALLFLNRVNFSGIINGGAIGGQSQVGQYKLDCRFNRERISEAIQAIAARREHIRIYEMDACDFLRDVILEENVPAFLNVDPPYVLNGARLYTSFYREEDHRTLAEFMRNEVADRFPWVMTYDDAQLIRDLYHDMNLRVYELYHSARQARMGTEIVVSANLEWFEWEGVIEQPLAE